MRVWVVVLLLAGCAGAKGGGDDVLLSDGSTVDLGDVETSATHGAIAGVVVDTSIKPMAGINLTLEPTGLTTSTDEGGVFRIEALEPGVYFVRVSGTGILTTQTSAEVEAGKVAKVRIVVERDLTPPPYHIPLTFDWYDSVGQPLVDFAFDLFRPPGAPPACDRCEWEFNSSAHVESFIIEATWKDSVDPPHRSSRFYWTLEPRADPSAYESEYFSNPGYARIDGNRWSTETLFFIMLAYEETWVAVEQSAEVFVTMFIGAEAPEGWSVVE